MYKQVSNLLFYYINTNPHNKRKLVEVRGSGQKALKMTNVYNLFQIDHCERMRSNPANFNVGLVNPTYYFLTQMSS